MFFLDLVMDFPTDRQEIDFFNTVFCFYGTLDSSGAVISLAGSIFERTFAEPQQLEGQRLADTVYWQTSNDNFLKLKDAVKSALEGHKVQTMLDFRVSKEEKDVIDVILFPVFDQPSGKLRHVFVCGKDVTAREKEIEFHKRRGEQLMYAAESADVGLWFWDLVEQKIFSTPKCNEFFERKPSETISYPAFLDVIHRDDRKMLRDIFFESQNTGSEYDVEYRIVQADGKIHWLSTRGKTYLDADGQPANMMGVVRRITDRKNADRELFGAHELERQAREEAVEANRTKDYFLALVSHELRSPLNAILGWAKILLTKEVDDKTHRSALETIERSALSQAKLISDLVDSSRIASGKLRLEMGPVNLYDAVQTIFNSQKPAAEAKNISLEFSSDIDRATVFGDLVRLQQIVSNLLSNALKFTPPGGFVRMSMDKDEKMVRISVRDNGQGISEETRPLLFRQFAQGEQTNSHDHNGMGLGLSIVKILAEKHKGDVTAHSDGPGKGAEFVVTLPLYHRYDPEKLSDSLNGHQKPLDGLKILCVEDDTDSREMLCIFLEQNGAEVTCGISAKEGIDLFREQKNRFHVIISDLAMPKEDGYALIRQIRAESADQEPPIPAIALSAYTSQGNRQLAFEAGFQRYHTKPFDPPRLISDIIGVLEVTTKK